MSQYTAGTVTTTITSNIVTGSGTLWLANVDVGDTIRIDTDAVYFTIASVDSNTQITLTANYTATKADADYDITRDFSPNRDYPLPTQGTARFGDFMAEVVRQIDTDANLGLTNMGTVQSVILTVPPASTVGYQYVIATGATGDWSGYDGYIADYTGTTGDEWDFTAPAAGYFVYNADDDFVYIYSDLAWAKWSLVTGDYLPKDGTTKSIDWVGDVLTTDAEIDAASLTVDTSTLVVDAANNRVGIGTAPSMPLHIYNSVAKLWVQDNDSADAYFEIYDRSASQVVLTKTNDSGGALMDFTPDPADGTGSAFFRIFRDTNTTGDRKVYIHDGDGSAGVSALIGAGGGNSYFNATGGNVGIGTDFTEADPPTKLLAVKGDIEIGIGSTGTLWSYNSGRIHYGKLELYDTGTGSVTLMTDYPGGDVVLKCGTSTGIIDLDGPTEVDGNLATTGELMGSRQNFILSNVTGATTLSSGTVYLKIGEVITTSDIGLVMHRAGSIVGYSMNYTTANAAESPVLIASILKNNVSVWDIPLTEAAGDRTVLGTQARGTDAFSAWDKITVRFAETAGGFIDATNLTAMIEVVFDD